MRKLTILLLIVVIVGLIVYDIIAASHGLESTITWVIWDWAVSFPIVPFAFGLLFGHLFWPNKAKCRDEVEKANRAAEHWENEARRYSLNTDYWRKEFDRVSNDKGDLL